MEQRFHGRLPHWEYEGSTYFVTFRLIHGILAPREVQIVLGHIRSGDPGFYDLTAAVIMPDHAHVVLRPNEGIALKRIMKGIKGVSANKLNEARGERGSLWQEGYFETIIRNEAMLLQKLRYMMDNPVRKGIIEDGWDYPGFYYKGSY